MCCAKGYVVQAEAMDICRGGHVGGRRVRAGMVGLAGGASCGITYGPQFDPQMIAVYSHKKSKLSVRPVADAHGP